MTYAVHSLHSPPVKVEVEGTKTGYRLNIDSRLVELPPTLEGGECFPTLHAAEEWQFKRLFEELCKLAPEKSEQVRQWLEDGRKPAAIRMELLK